MRRGECKMRCGRKVAPGEYKGKPFTTCCRACAAGKGHSEGCGEEGGCPNPEVVAVATVIAIEGAPCGEGSAASS